MSPVYDEEESYPERFSVRAPLGLTERTKRMRQTERIKSLNRARVRALELGISVYELIAKNNDEFRAMRTEERLTVVEAVTKLLEEALEARRTKKKR